MKGNVLVSQHFLWLHLNVRTDAPMCLYMFLLLSGEPHVIHEHNTDAH